MKLLGQFNGDNDYWSTDFQFRFYINFNEKVTYFTRQTNRQDFELSYRVGDGFCNFIYKKDRT